MSKLDFSGVHASAVETPGFKFMHLFATGAFLWFHTLPRDRQVEMADAHHREHHGRYGRHRRYCAVKVEGVAGRFVNAWHFRLFPRSTVTAAALLAFSREPVAVRQEWNAEAVKFVDVDAHLQEAPRDPVTIPGTAHTLRLVG